MKKRNGELEAIDADQKGGCTQLGTAPFFNSFSRG
jgi:hypothetical protein